MPSSLPVILQADGLKKRFRQVAAVEDVSLEIQEGEILGLVGESGSGKSTLARLLMRLLEPDAGRIYFRGVELTSLSERELRPFRRQIQLVFQDPDAALNPRQTIRASLRRGYQALGWSAADSDRAMGPLVESLGIDRDVLDCRPQQLSGGQKQRIVIARALSMEPCVLIADEPTASLDASVAVQVLNLLRNLVQKRRLAMLFISHDLRVVNYLCDRIGVLEAGRLVEIGDRESILRNPRLAYTQQLVRAFEP